MGKQHETIPNEPQEAPVRPEQPEIKQPNDPQTSDIPPEAPVTEPTEVPQRPAEQPEKTNAPSVAAELLNRSHH